MNKQKHGHNAVIVLHAEYEFITQRRFDCSQLHTLGCDQAYNFRCEHHNNLCKKHRNNIFFPLLFRN